MKDKKKYFAKPLDKWDRFYTTIRMISSLFPEFGLRPFFILYYLMNMDDSSHNNIMYEAITPKKAGVNTRKKIRALFVKIYNNEDLIVDYLNKKITKRYLNQNRETKVEISRQADREVSAIMDDLGLFDVIEQDG